MTLFVRTTAMFLTVFICFTTLVSAQNNSKNGTTPAGDNSKIVSYDIPENMKQGEEFVVTIAMINNGKNKWKKSENYQLSLYNEIDNMYQADVWGIKNVSLPYDVNAGEKINFLFKITAPFQSGTYNSQWVMTKNNESFGEYTAALIKVGDAQSYDGNSSQFISMTVPEFMISGEKYKVAITLKNTGTNPWYSASGGDYKISPVTDSLAALFEDWNSSPQYLSHTIDTGVTSTIEFDIVAPQAPGVYNLRWRMQKGSTFFGQPTNKIQVTVSKNSKSVSDSRTQNSAFMSQEIPDYMFVNESQNVSVTMSNIGNRTWIKGNEQLVIVDQNLTPVTLNPWGAGYIQLPENVDPGKTVTFNFQVKPRETGWQYFQMMMMNEEGKVFGSPTKSVEVIVSPK